jgi:hypothetical protein
MILSVKEKQTGAGEAGKMNFGKGHNSPSAILGETAENGGQHEDSYGSGQRDGKPQNCVHQ